MVLAPETEQYRFTARNPGSASNRRTVEGLIAMLSMNPHPVTPSPTAPPHSGARGTPDDFRSPGVKDVLNDLHREEDGLATAEYGIVMLAAVGFAGLLVAVLSSGEVREMLAGIVQRALSF